MKYGYYPGCSLHCMAAEYNHSTKDVCNKLGVELIELPDWNCCGASSAHSTGHLMGLAIPARNLAIAEEQGLDIVAPCAACYQRLACAQYEIEHDPKVKENINKAIERDYQGSTKVFSIVEPIVKIGYDEIKSKVVKPLEGLKVACYYGCYLVKPPKFATVDDSEYPESLDNIMQAIGAETVEWPYRTECCGGSLVLSETDIVLKCGHDIIKYAKEAGADCIVTACPLCQPNLDTRQGQINKKFGTNYDVPIFYFTELLALALGTNKSDLKLNKHLVDPTKLLANY